MHLRADKHLSSVGNMRLLLTTKKHRVAGVSLVDLDQNGTNIADGVLSAAASQCFLDVLRGLDLAVGLEMAPELTFP